MVAVSKAGLFLNGRRCRSSLLRLAGIVATVLMVWGCGARMPVQPLPEPTPLPEAITPTDYTIQLGTFTQLDNAVRFTHSLEEQGLEAYYFRDAKGLFKVRFGDFSSREIAHSTAERLVREGIIEAYYIVSPDEVHVVRTRVRRTQVLRENIVNTAESFLGLPYRWGGSSVEQGFDCSGLVMAVYRLNGLKLPRSSKDQYRAGRRIDQEELVEGDLVFFTMSEDDKIFHVGIYVGEGKFIHAPGQGKTIRVNFLSDAYYAQRFLGARAYL
ncbi:MAG: NlpC/P60 family protein [Pseudomonadota bacterium]|nr:C40 family peptidase [Desulfobacterales bacterium]MBL7101240.1 C40 family peptidase [Desulfobacteraceae bacterium]MBL7172299.1 C40 family peptidase [Desulfobacteraceae bacterium]MBU0735602.1 C40 family peptidase [Pseudomonadota bacterium]